MYQEVLSTQRKTLRRDDPSTTMTMMSLGEVLIDNGDFVDAEELLQECFEIKRDKSPNVYTTYKVQSLLGAAQLGCQKFEVAKLNLVEGYQGIKTKKPPSNLYLIRALEQLVKLAEETDNSEDVEKWQAEQKRIGRELD